MLYVAHTKRRMAESAEQSPCEIVCFLTLSCTKTSASDPFLNIQEVVCLHICQQHKTISIQSSSGLRNKVPIGRFLMKGKTGSHLVGKPRKGLQRLLNEARSRKGKGCWGGQEMATSRELGRWEDCLVNIN